MKLRISVLGGVLFIAASLATDMPWDVMLCALAFGDLGVFMSCVHD